MALSARSCGTRWRRRRRRSRLLVAPAVRTKGGREPSQAREEKRGEERSRIDRHNGVAQASGQVRSDDDNGDNRGKQGG